MNRVATSVAILVMCCTSSATAADTAGQDVSPDNLEFEGYPEAPAFTVTNTKRKLRKLKRRRRCSRCHAAMDPNPTVRELELAPHVDGISHGKGQLWCLVCHDEKDRDHLRTLLNEKVAFSTTYLVCSSCHAKRQKDWYFGGHGKRVSNWQGERVIYDCTYCHDPHEPAIQPREPKPPPKVRVGLEEMPRADHRQLKIWDRISGNTQAVSHD